MKYTDTRYNEHKVDAETAKKNGEVWTPPEIIDQMIAKIPAKNWSDPTKTFLDPTCGTGNIIVRMLEKRLASGVSKKDAISTLYGVELEQANVDICKERIRCVLGDGTATHKFDDIIDKNIVCHDFFTWDFENWCPKASENPESDFEEFFE